jgi:hypothetical protein
VLVHFVPSLRAVREVAVVETVVERDIVGKKVGSQEGKSVMLARQQPALGAEAASIFPSPPYQNGATTGVKN